MRARRLAAGIVALLALVLSACVPRVPEVVKIGVVAPFEGEHREIGYDVIPAVRLATREWAAQAGGRVAFEVVAYDDGGISENAPEVARRLTADPDVAVVIGHWRDDTTLAALPVYAAADIPVVAWATADTSYAGQVYNLAPSAATLEEAAESWLENQALLNATVDLSLPLPPDGGDVVIGGPNWASARVPALAGTAAEGATFVTGAALPADAAPDPAGFEEAFAEGNLGAQPGPFAWAAYRAAWVAMQIVAGDVEGAPVALPEFDSTSHDPAAPIYVYRWSAGELALQAKLK